MKKFCLHAHHKGENFSFFIKNSFPFAENDDIHNCCEKEIFIYLTKLQHTSLMSCNSAVVEKSLSFAYLINDNFIFFIQIVVLGINCYVDIKRKIRI